MWCCFYNIIPLLFTRTVTVIPTQKPISITQCPMGVRGARLIIPTMFAFLMCCIFYELMVIHSTNVDLNSSLHFCMAVAVVFLINEGTYNYVIYYSGSFQKMSWFKHDC